MRSRIVQVAALIVAAALTGFIAARVIVVLAGLRPHFGGYWYTGVAGALVAIAAPALSLRAMAREHVPRWPIWLFVGFAVAVVTGTRLFAFAHVKVATQPPSTPSPVAFLLLVSVAFTAAGLTELALFIIFGLAGLLAPGPFRRLWLRWRPPQQVAQARPARKPSPPARKPGRGGRKKHPARPG